jgi:hypothetical protein
MKMYLRKLGMVPQQRINKQPLCHCGLVLLCIDPPAGFLAFVRLDEGTVTVAEKLLMPNPSIVDGEDRHIRHVGPDQLKEVLTLRARS